MPVTCEIKFENNPMKVVSAGGNISGKVRLVLTDRKIVSGVYIQIYGSAFVRWIERLDSGEHPKEYTGNEEYLNEKTYFLRSGAGGTGTVRLDPGIYQYSFQCMLPPELPTSVEGSYGYIRYIVRVVLDFRLHPEMIFEEPFTVIKMINLNDEPALRKPIASEKNKTIFPCFLCCCSSEFMKISARVPVRAYTPGQTINLEINIYNRSNQLVSEFSVQLIKLIAYFTHANSSFRKFERIHITEQDTHGCDVNQDEIIRVNIEVPAIPPTDHSSSNIIKVRYIIRIIGLLGCCHRNPVLELPIIIGSYPIEDAYPFGIVVNTVGAPDTSSNDVITQQPLSSNPTGQEENLTVPSSNTQNASTSTEDQPPPTYEEATMQSIENSENIFRPKYPVFKRTTSYSIGGTH